MLCASKNMGHVAEIRDYASDDSGKTPHPYEQVCSLHVASRDAGADASNPCQSYSIHMFFFVCTISIDVKPLPKDAG